MEVFLWGELFLYFPIFLFLEVGSPITGWPPTPGPPAFTSHWMTSMHYQVRLWGFPKATELAKARADPVKPSLTCGMKNTRPRMARAVRTEALENLHVPHLLSVSSLKAKCVFSTFLQNLPFPEEAVHVAEARLTWNGGRGAVSHKYCTRTVQLTDHWTNSWGCSPSTEEPDLQSFRTPVFWIVTVNSVEILSGCGSSPFHNGINSKISQQYRNHCLNLTFSVLATG